MPNWSTEIPDDPRGQGLPLVRTPAARSLVAIVTSDNLIGCETHFWGGHTVPCDGPECEACQAGIAYRWHAYLAAFNPADRLHFVFECTAQAAARFKEYRLEHGTLRCCQFEAYRWKRAKNGRVIIKCDRSNLAPAALPNAPDLPKVMAVIWRLPIPNVYQVGVERGHPHVETDARGNGQSADPREYTTPQP